MSEPYVCAGCGEVATGPCCVIDVCSSCDGECVNAVNIGAGHACCLCMAVPGSDPCRMCEAREKAAAMPYECEFCGEMCAALHTKEDNDPAVGYRSTLEVCAKCAGVKP